MKYIRNAPELKEKRKELRKNQTDAEKSFWTHVRNRRFHGLKFFRQYSVSPYILDFYCPSKRLVIEIDGGQHYTPEGKTRDKTREKYLNQHDIEVIRYSDRDALTKVDAVLQDILNKLGSGNSSPLPSPQRGEGTKVEYSPQRGEGTWVEKLSSKRRGNLGSKNLPKEGKEPGQNELSRENF